MDSVFSDRLKKLRERKNISQTRVAEAIGVKNNTLSGYESGRRQPDNDTLKRIADYFDVSADYLLGRTGSPTVKMNKTDPFDELEIIDGEEIFFSDLKNMSYDDKKAVVNHIRALRALAAEKNKNDDNK